MQKTLTALHSKGAVGPVRDRGRYMDYTTHASMFLNAVACVWG